MFCRFIVYLLSQTNFLFSFLPVLPEGWLKATGFGDLPTLACQHHDDHDHDDYDHDDHHHDDDGDGCGADEYGDDFDDGNDHDHDHDPDHDDHDHDHDEQDLDQCHRHDTGGIQVEIFRKSATALLAILHAHLKFYFVK